MKNLAQVVADLERQKTEIDAALRVLRRELEKESPPPGRLRPAAKPRPVSGESQSAKVRHHAVAFLDAHGRPQKTSKIRAYLEKQPDLTGFNFNTLLYNVLSRAAKSPNSRIVKRGTSWTTENRPAAPPTEASA